MRFFLVFALLLCAASLLTTPVFASKKEQRHDYKIVQASRHQYLIGPDGFKKDLGLHEDDVGVKFGYDYTRADILEATANYLDEDGDHRFSLQEVKDIRQDCLHWYEKLVDWISKGEKPEDIMRKCDLDEDGYIDWDDFIEAGDFCSAFDNEDDLPNGTCLCDRKAIEGMYKYVLSRKEDGTC